MMQVLAMMAQQCSVYTHRILCDNTFVNFIEFFCICPVHIELWKGNITYDKQAEKWTFHNNALQEMKYDKKQWTISLMKWKYFT